MSRITTFSFNKDTFWAAGGFMFVKNLLLVINFLSLLAGILFIAGGAYIKSQSSDENLLNITSAIAGWSVAIGVTVTIVSFLGCFGAANEKGMLLKTYFALLLLLVILEIGIGIAAYAKKDDVDGLLNASWRDAFATDGGQQSIKAVQNTFQCCGYANVTDMAVPASCATDPNTRKDVPSCRTLATAALQGSLNSVGGAGVALGIIELIGLIFSVILFRRIASKDRASESLMNEAWRINRNKIQYGYQNYQYI